MLSGTGTDLNTKPEVVFIAMDIQDSHDDYVDLLNTVQRHTHCSSNYCLRKRQNESDVKCRFKFPFEPCISTKLEFEPIHTNDKSTKYKAKIITKRNDPRLNNHQRLQLQGWRANCDIQVVIDYHACIEYLAKYASKGEPRSPVMKTAFNSIVCNCNMDSSPTKLIKKVIMKSLGERDFSAQETMHHLMSLKLVSSSLNLIPVSLNSSRKIKTNSPDGDIATNDSLLDVYANRGKYTDTIRDKMTLNFITFATKYKLVNSKLTAQPGNTIAKVFAVYQPGTDEIYITKWKEFLETSFAESMFLTGMKSYTLYKITLKMTQILNKPHKSSLNVKSGCF